MITPREVSANIGKKVTVWDDGTFSYNEGILVGMNSNDEIDVKFGQKIESVSAINVHLGPISEVAQDEDLVEQELERLDETAADYGVDDPDFFDDIDEL